MKLHPDDYHQFDALILDMDGTLIDSGQVHEQAWTKALKQFDIPVDAGLMRSLAGVPTAETVDKLSEHFQLEPKPNSLEVARTKNQFAAALAPKLLKATALADLVRNSHGIKKIALGTGAQSAEAAAVLQLCGLAEYFPVIVGGDRVSAHKPAPDTFLLCAEELGVEPSRCVVFEDSVLGMRAAHAAGMTVIDVAAELNIHNDYFLAS